MESTVIASERLGVSQLMAIRNLLAVDIVTTKGAIIFGLLSSEKRPQRSEQRSLRHLSLCKRCKRWHAAAYYSNVDFDGTETSATRNPSDII